MYRAEGLEVSWRAISVLPRREWVGGKVGRTYQWQFHHGETKTQNIKCCHLMTRDLRPHRVHWVGENHCLQRTVSPAQPSLCSDSREMRRKCLTVRPKNLTTLDLLIGDEILYRDENYFAELKTAARPNPSVSRIPSLSTNQEISESDSSSESILMQKKSLLMVTCKLCSSQWRPPAPSHRNGCPTGGDCRPWPFRGLQGNRGLQLKL